MRTFPVAVTHQRRGFHERKGGSLAVFSKRLLSLFPAPAQPARTGPPPHGVTFHVAVQGDRNREGRQRVRSGLPNQQGVAIRGRVKCFTGRTARSVTKPPSRPGRKYL